MKLNMVGLISLGSLLFASCSSLKKAPVNATASDYKLAWSDEFNKDGPVNAANWQFEQGFVRNHEDQWYQQQNLRCTGGHLIIEGRRETMANPTYTAGTDDWKKKRDSVHYTSSSINTSGKHSWKYGRFIMRGRIDISEGLWPAWWTLGIDRQWPANGEIDIMEFYQNKLLANIACLGENGKPTWFSNRFSADSLGGKKWASQFHIWRMDWTETSISLFVDNHLLNVVELAGLVNKDGSNFNPFTQPHYMLLNLAIGGDNGGNPTNTIFPTHFEVDYVRVYQKSER